MAHLVEAWLYVIDCYVVKILVIGGVELWIHNLGSPLLGGVVGGFVAGKGASEVYRSRFRFLLRCSGFGADAVFVDDHFMFLGDSH